MAQLKEAQTCLEQSQHLLWLAQALVEQDCEST
jgi:hypothetical protein